MREAAAGIWLLVLRQSSQVTPVLAEAGASAPVTVQRVIV